MPIGIPLLLLNSANLTDLLFYSMASSKRPFSFFSWHAMQ